jgi:hypothetical protein
MNFQMQNGEVSKWERKGNISAKVTLPNLTWHFFMSHIMDNKKSNKKTDKATACAL